MPKGIYKHNKRSKETKTKISKSLTGFKHSEDSKKKMSEVNMGKSLSDETKIKMSKSHIGKHKQKRTKETKIKMSKSHIGKHLSEETKNKISNSHKGNNSFWYGKKLPESTKEKMSESHKGLNCGKNNPSYGKPRYHTKRYFYNSPLQGKVCFRSSYELAYAKWLDSQKILWCYEIETFELSNEMTYTPDFFLPRIDKFIEIKGFMRYKDKEKINKFLEEYPWNLEILYKEDLLRLGVKLC